MTSVWTYWTNRFSEYKWKLVQEDVIGFEGMVFSAQTRQLSLNGVFRTWTLSIRKRWSKSIKFLEKSRFADIVRIGHWKTLFRNVNPIAENPYSNMLNRKTNFNNPSRRTLPASDVQHFFGAISLRAQQTQTGTSSTRITNKWYARRSIFSKTTIPRYEFGQMSKPFDRHDAPLRTYASQ